MARIIRDAIALLNRLIRLDRAAIDAYGTVLTRPGDPDDVAQLRVFIGDHRRHVDELALVVRNLGGEPAALGDLHDAIARGKLGGEPVGPEVGHLEALRRCEAEAEASYEDAVSQPGIPVDVLAVLERGLHDEREHHRWVARVAPAGVPLVRR